MVLAAATAADWLVFFRARALRMARGLMKESVKLSGLVACPAGMSFSAAVGRGCYFHTR
jgi:hypothetical protein